MDIKFMKQAIKQARLALEQEEIPVGAVIVQNGKIIAKGYNKKEHNNDCTMHAEIIAIKKASKKIQNWRLNDCEMYITLEPCAMCAGAIISSRIKKVYIGAKDKNLGAGGSKINILNCKELNTKTEVEYGICEEESTKLLKDFFKKIR